MLVSVCGLRHTEVPPAAYAPTAELLYRRRLLERSVGRGRNRN